MTVPTSAPVKVCPHCGVQAQTVEMKCPHCGKKYKKKSAALKILLGIAVLMIAIIGGCMALVGGAVNEAVETLNEEQAKSAISQETFDGIQIGATRADVDAAVAPAVPQDAQEFTQEGVLDQEQINTSCIYFNRDGGTFGDVFQFCFDGDRLTSKNSY
ncbi:hypothetical protein ACI782_11815 [Geodermatophilus sp. SYSU D00703]